MNYRFLSILFAALLIMFLLSLIILLTVFLVRVFKNHIEVNELIETDKNINSIRYIVTLKNSKNKNIHIKDFGVIVKPYKITLKHEHFPLLENSNLEIKSNNIINLDMTYLINSKIIKGERNKVYFYYEDAFSERHVFKSKMLKRFIKIQNRMMKKTVM